MDNKKITEELKNFLEKINNEIKNTANKEIQNAINEFENKLKREINEIFLKVSLPISKALDSLSETKPEPILYMEERPPSTEKKTSFSNSVSNTDDDSILDYLGGFRNEELRILVKNYTEQLKDSDALLIIYRLNEEEQDNFVFGKELQSIVGDHWDFIHEQTSSDNRIQQLISKLSTCANEGLKSLEFLSLYERKSGDYNKNKLYFGILGRKNTKITHLKGIIHQQNPIGMNIESLCESDAILQALIETNILRLLGKSRYVLAKDISRERILNTDFKPDVNSLTHAVIEMNIYVDPDCIINYLEFHIKNYSEQHIERIDLYKEFLNSIEKMKRRLKDDTYVFGIDMLHDITKLITSALIYCGEYGKKLVSDFNLNERNYIGEISFTSIISGTLMIHRIKSNNGELFLGENGLDLLTKKIQTFFLEMSQVNPDNYSKKIETMSVEKVNISQNIASILKQIYSLVKSTLTEESKSQIIEIEKEINTTYNTIQKATDILLSLRLENDFIIVPELENAIKTLVEKLLPNRRKQRDLVSEVLPQLPSFTKIKYEMLRTKIIEMEKSIQVLEDIILSLRKHYKILEEANNKLHRAIQYGKTLLQIICPKEKYKIAAYSSISLTEMDKEIFNKYGAQYIEVPNRLFVSMPDHSIPNRMFINDNYFYRITHTPYLLEIDIYASLNSWAEEYTMTVQDYIDAYFWVHKGQSLLNFPDSGRWTIAETLYQENESCRLLFYNFGSNNEVKILNPFWKDIGLYLLKDIADGQAFQGEEFRQVNFDHPLLKNIKINLQHTAKEIMNIGTVEFIENKVRKIFIDYLNAMTSLHTQSHQDSIPRFKAYSRNTSDFKNGFVKQGILSWDKYIYQSANTSFIDEESSKFFMEMREKRIQSGQNLLELVPNFEEGYHEPSSLILREMQKSESENEHEHIYNLGMVYLKAREAHGSYTESSDKDTLNKIEVLVKKYENFVSPAKSVGDIKIEDASIKNIPLYQESKTEKMFVATKPIYPELLNKYVSEQNAAIQLEQVIIAIEQIKLDKGTTVALETLDKFETWVNAKD